MLLADWRANKYKFIKKNEVDDVRRLFHQVQVNVSKCYDVITRYRNIIVFFPIPVTWYANAYIEDDLAKESRYTRF